MWGREGEREYEIYAREYMARKNQTKYKSNREIDKELMIFEKELTFLVMYTTLSLYPQIGTQQIQELYGEVMEKLYKESINVLQNS